MSARQTDGYDVSAGMATLDEIREAVGVPRRAGVEKALGGVHFGISVTEAGSRIFRRCLFVVCDLKAGEEFTGENIRSIHPGYGLAPKHLTEIPGRRASVDILRGTLPNWCLVAGGLPKQ